MMKPSQLHARIVDIHAGAHKWDYVFATFETMVDAKVPIDSFTFATVAYAYTVSFLLHSRLFLSWLTTLERKHPTEALEWLAKTAEMINVKPNYLVYDRILRALIDTHAGGLIDKIDEVLGEMVKENVLPTKATLDCLVDLYLIIDLAK